jgi:membrane peptidoglycan carboxypeptidase
VARTITPEVAAELTTIMEQVVERGTARAAQIDGYRIAGKTGTAAKVIDGRYSTTHWNASFVGFVPAQKPAFTLIVLIDSPHAKGHTGGVAAAPVFKRIAEAALRQYGIPPSLNPPPAILVARHTDPGPERPASVTINGPSAGARIVTGAPAVLTGATASNRNLFPDLKGMSARDALRTLAQLGMTARIHGTGIVSAQDPSPGEPVERGAVSTLWLDRQPPLTLASAPQP